MQKQAEGQGSPDIVRPIGLSFASMRRCKRANQISERTVSVFASRKMERKNRICYDAFDMTITWYGLSCFKVETHDATLAFSPFSKIEEWGIQKSPRFKADIVFVSQNTPAYNNVSGIEGGMVRIDEPGEYESNGIMAYGIATANPKQKDAVQNTVFVVRAEQMVIGYLGGLGEAKLSEETIHKLEGVDILFIPVGGAGTCSASYAASLISQLEPSVIVPMHYKVLGMKGRMDGIDSFLKEVNMKAEEQDKVSIRQRDISDAETRLVLLRPQLVSKA